MLEQEYFTFLLRAGSFRVTSSSVPGAAGSIAHTLHNYHTLRQKNDKTLLQNILQTRKKCTGQYYTFCTYLVEIKRKLQTYRRLQNLPEYIFKFAGTTTTQCDHHTTMKIYAYHFTTSENRFSFK